MDSDIFSFLEPFLGANFNFSVLDMRALSFDKRLLDNCKKTTLKHLAPFPFCFSTNRSAQKTPDFLSFTPSVRGALAVHLRGLLRNFHLAQTGILEVKRQMDHVVQVAVAADVAVAEQSPAVHFNGLQD